MPSPSRWGPAAGYVNVSAPGWVWDAIDRLRQENDWKTIGNAGLELIVEALAARGVRAPESPGNTSAYATGEALFSKVADGSPPPKRKSQAAPGARGGRRE